MSPRLRYLLTKTLPFLGVPITLLVSQVNLNAASILFGLTLGGVIVGNIYAELLLRCPNCKWRIGAYGRAFVRSLPPRQCPQCGAKLD